MFSANYFLPKHQSTPKISSSKKKGSKAVNAKIAALTPIRAMLRDGTSKLFLLVLTFLGLYLCFETEQPSIWAWTIASLLPITLYPLYYLIIGLLLTRAKFITFQPKKISFWRLCWLRSFDPAQLQFVLSEHSRASLEKERHEHYKAKDQLKKRVRRRKSYFQNSLVLVAVHPKGRTKIMTIYDQSHAKRCLDALNSAKAQVEAMARTGSGISLNAEDEWRDSSGDLPS